jgi:hypothetical protein
MQRPEATEYASFFSGYVSLVPEADVLGVLGAQVAELRALAAGVPAERETFRYEPAKWSIREVFGHLGDAERVFGHRAFCISRGEKASLPGFDENAYVEGSDFNRRSLASLVGELCAVRSVNLEVLKGVDLEGWRRQGMANGTPVSVGALAFIMAGHVRHHLKVLASRYLVQAPS